MDFGTFLNVVVGVFCEEEFDPAVRLGIPDNDRIAGVGVPRKLLRRLRNRTA